jgi:hypothetical protein
MNNSAAFRVAKNDLLPALKQLKKIEKASKKRESTLEVTIIDDYLQLVIPGIQLQVNAVTDGSAKFTIRLWYFTDIINAEKIKDLQFSLTENQLKLRSFTWGVLTTFFETDSILRSINLPVNYKYLDVARLYLSEKYTTDEIIFNNLDKEVVDAINKLNTDIDNASSIMREYGFSRKEIEALILDKLKGT